RTRLMKLTLLALSSVVLALIAIGCTETATSTNTATPRTASASPAPAATASVATDEFAHAKALYAKNCEGCHGPNAEGGIAKVDNKQIKVPSLKSDHAIKHTDDQIAKMITNGEEAMPAFKDKMSQAEIADMVKFVRTHFQGK
ncbi:MAG TPA: cytochrome c, partial [Pyrinomonadaceae bacterium]|nr:cytochrome c [Pyrinomonadaceae bacterium]